MKKILLISNYVFHYRISNYNYFYEEFKKIGYEFIVLANDAQKVDFDIKFQLIIQKPGPLNYFRTIEQIKPDAVIVFLHLKDLIIFFVSYYCKIRRIPTIYWNFGINIVEPESKIKNAIYYHLHNISNALLLYSPNEKQVIKERNLSKTFVAYNTLNFTGIDFNSFTEKKYLQKEYGVKENFVLLFVGRITGAKRLDILLNILRNNKDIAIVIVGKGMGEECKTIIDQTDNYYYLGEIPYNNDEIGRIFYSADLFCIPGNIGLGLNEAFFWAKPVLTLEGPNSPEIYYLKNGINGYIVKDTEDLEKKVLELYQDSVKYAMLSKSAKETANHEAHISQMYNGFLEAIRYVMK